MFLFVEENNERFKQDEQYRFKVIKIFSYKKHTDLNESIGHLFDHGILYLHELC